MNKKNMVSFMIAGSLLAVSAHAFANDDRMSAFDTDGDGTVTEAEVLAVKTEYFTNADADSSGYLSLAEFENLKNSQQETRIETAFAALDTDISSTLTLDEMSVDAPEGTGDFLANIFALADNTADSALSIAEFTNLQKKGNDSGIWKFASLDTDFDQQVSLEEFTAQPAKAKGSRGGKGRGGKRGQPQR